MITQKINPHVQSSFSAPKQMSIAANGKAFKIIASSLYKNIHKAILVEYCQNQNDSHIKAKNSDQFIVDLPTAFNPILKFTDFGVGMSPEFVENEYLSVFTSTKDKNNKESGGWGCGRISLLGMVDSYILTTIYSGKKHIYNLFFNNDGIPCLNKIGEEKTKDRNGVIVECAVNHTDINHLRNNLNVLKWFPNPPLVKVGEEIIKIDPIKKGIIFGEDWYFPADKQYKSYIHSGCYAYEIDASNLDFTQQQKSLLESGVVIQVPIGKVSVNASRESISWDDATFKFVKNKLNDILIELHEKYSKLISGQTTYYLACKEYNKIITSPDIQNTQLKNVFDKIDFKWNNENVKKYFNIISTKRIPNPNVNPDPTNRTKIWPAEISEPLFNELTQYYWIDYEKRMANIRNPHSMGCDHILIYKDIHTSYWKTRVKNFIRETSKKILYVDSNNFDEFFKLNRLEGIEVIKLSSLPKPNIVRSKSASSDNKIFRFKETYRWCAKNTDRWESADIEGIEYYVPIKNYEAELGNSNLLTLIEYARKVNLISKDTIIYGIRKSYIPNLDEDCINFIDFLKKNIKKEMFYFEIVDEDNKVDLSNLTGLEKLDETKYLCPDLVSLIKNIKYLSKVLISESNFSTYNYLKGLRILNFEIEFKPVKLDIKTQKILDKHPLLNYIEKEHWSKDEVVNYINRK